MADTPEEQPINKALVVCQQILRFMTGIFLVSLVLIILLTTISTGSFVQVTAKVLYYLILLSGLVSLMTWLYRTRIEKRLRMPPII